VAFLSYLKNNQIGPIHGFELGNEMTKTSHIDMETNIDDYITLFDIVDKVWSEGNAPGVYGPSTDICNVDVVKFMEATKGKLSGFTYHSYPGNNGSTLYRDLLNINWLRNNILLDDTHANSTVCISAWNHIGRRC
jgi:hypothetical protein